MVVINILPFGALPYAYVGIIWLCLTARDYGVESVLRRGPPGPPGPAGPAGPRGPPGYCPRPWAVRNSRRAVMQGPESQPQAEAQFQHAEITATRSEAFSSAGRVSVVRRQADASRGPPGFPGPAGPMGPTGPSGLTPRWCRDGRIHALVKRDIRGTISRHWFPPNGGCTINS